MLRYVLFVALAAFAVSSSGVAGALLPLPSFLYGLRSHLDPTPLLIAIELPPGVEPWSSAATSYFLRWMQCAHVCDPEADTLSCHFHTDALRQAPRL